MQALLLYVVPVAALALFNRSNERPAGFFLFLYALYAFWIGNKFGVFFTMAYCVLLVFFPKISALSKKDVGRVSLVICGVFASLFLLASASQVLVFDQGIGEYGNYLASRVAQQGQMWWSFYDICDGAAPHFEEIGQEVTATFNTIASGEQDYGAGIYKAMQMVNPTDFAFKVSTGSRYTEAGYGLAFYYLGVFGVLTYAVVFATLFFLVVNWFIVAIARGWVVEAAILFRLYNKVATAQSMFLFDDLFSPTTLLLLAVLIILIAARLRRRRLQPSETLYKRAEPNRVNCCVDGDVCVR